MKNCEHDFNPEIFCLVSHKTLDGKPIPSCKRCSLCGSLIAYPYDTPCVAKKPAQTQDTYKPTPGFLKPGSPSLQVFDVQFLPIPKKPTRIEQIGEYKHFYNVYEGQEYCYASIRDWPTTEEIGK